MSRWFLSTLLVFFSASAASGQAAKKESTILGEVVDIATYVRFETKPDNPDRRAIAEASVKNGNPLGILERNTGNIYLVSSAQGNAMKTLAQYFGQRIYVKGVVYKRGGIRLLLMSDIGKSIK